MFNQLSISAAKGSVVFTHPLMNAAGTLGFSQEAAELVPMESLGAFITNPISRLPRSPANDSIARRFENNWLLHSGHPNPGLSTACRQFRRAWSKVNVPLVVHIFARDSREFEKMILDLEGEPSVDAIELGMELTDLMILDQVIPLCQQSELPIFPRLPLDAPAAAFERAVGLGAPAISFGPPRGVFQGSAGNLIGGRLYGPALFPLALSKLREIREICPVPIIAAGGIGSADQVQILLTAGAKAVQLDFALWAKPEELGSSAD